MSTILQLRVTHRDTTAEYFGCYVIIEREHMKLRIRGRSGRREWKKWGINIIKDIYETLKELTKIFKKIKNRQKDKYFALFKQ